MKKRLLPTIILIAYTALLIKVMVLKDVPLIRIGHLMLNFGGTAEGQANFVPFKTIVPYLLGFKGLIIAGINLVGNIALLVPLGFLVMLVYPNIRWKKSLALAAATGLVIEGMQVLLHVGIFDIDDVILNVLGFMIGYWSFLILAKWVRERNYKNILIAATVVIVAAAAAFYVVYPWGQPVVNPGVGAGGQFDSSGKNREGEIPQSGDLCGGTGGNGQIVSVENNTIVMERNDGIIQTINLTDQARIETSTGSGSVSDLKTGDRITLVGGPNPDGSFTASTVVVCNAPGPETEAEQ